MLPEGSHAHMVLIVKNRKQEALLLISEVYRSIYYLAEHVLPKQSPCLAPLNGYCRQSASNKCSLSCTQVCLGIAVLCAKPLPWESSQEDSSCLWMLGIH